jgi:glycosyltransferase involved in cell wall biosynthesis
MKLLIISHTAHYMSSEGELVGWGPTLREIDHLTTLFDTVYHCAPLHEGDAPSSSMAYEMKEKVHFIPLAPSGGESFLDKLGVLKKAPGNLAIVRKALKEADVYQFRAPTGIGIYLIPWLKWFSGKPGWFKYAGNWVQKNAPIGYRVQRWMLKRFNRQRVTINGSWPGQKEHCVTFENPCLTHSEIELGREIVEQKDYNGFINFCFVGRLQSAKGVGHILEAFKKIGPHPRIGEIHLIGDGPEKDLFIEKSRDLDVSVIFHGFVTRKEVGDMLKKCHLFLLPSASEGFPKVVAEAANYGCVPLVSDVSSLSQYIMDGENGFLVRYSENIADELADKIVHILSESDLGAVSGEANKLSPKFSYDYYIQRIDRDIIAPLFHVAKCPEEQPVLNENE